MLNKFHVVTVISNPVRYKSRYDLYRKFEKFMSDSGVTLWTVEQAFGARPWEITTPKNKHHIQLRSSHELWHKENMINIGVSRLPDDCEYVAWIDADVLFHRPDWALETVHQLQHYQVVQLFAHALDLGPKGEPMQMHRGFVKGYFDCGFKCPNMTAGGKGGTEYYYGGALAATKPNLDYYGGKTGAMAHPGYAWAARRSALSSVGGLIDIAILGSADHHMAMGLIGECAKTFPPQMHTRYVQKMLLWQGNAVHSLNKNIGYVDGMISHFWHGKKADRRYKSRWDILLKNGFDPDRDLVRDSQGLLQLTDHNIGLRDDIRAYFRQRNEDSIDI